MGPLSRRQFPAAALVAGGVLTLAWVVATLPESGIGSILLYPVGFVSMLSVVTGVIGLGFPRSRVPPAVLTGLVAALSVFALLALSPMLLSFTLVLVAPFTVFVLGVVLAYIVLGRTGPWAPDVSSAPASE